MRSNVPQPPTVGKVYVAGGEIWELSVKQGSVRPVSPLANRRGVLWNDLFTVRGNQIIFAWQEENSDLWLMDATIER